MGGPVLPAVAGVGAGNVGAGNVADVPGGIDQPRRSSAALPGTPTTDVVSPIDTADAGIQIAWGDDLRSSRAGAGDIEAGTPLLEPEKTHAAAPKKKKVKLSLLDPAVMAKAESDAQAEQCIQELSDKP